MIPDGGDLAEVRLSRPRFFFSSAGALVVLAGVAVCPSGCASRAPEASPVVAIAGAGEPTLGLSSAPPPEGAAEAPKPKLLQWETDEPSARARARRERLPLFVFLGAKWSGGSLGMEREVFSDPRFLFQRSPIVALSIDLTDGDDPNAELFADRYGARSMPTTIVFDAEGREVARLEGPASLDDVLSAIGKAFEPR